MNSHKNHFQLNGYTSVSSLFSPEESAAMRTNVDRYLREIAPGLTDGDAIVPRMSTGEVVPNRFLFLARMDVHDPFFRELKHDTRLSDLARDLLGCEVEAQHVQFFDVIPGVSRPTPPHQDAPIFLIQPSHAVTFWIPLSEMKEEHGCLHYVPGSHWHGYLAHEQGGARRLENYDDYREHGVAMPVKSGDLLAHHCFTIHYSTDNLSGDSRWALAIHFYPVGSRKVDEREWLRRGGR